MKIAVVQMNSTVGDFEGNTARVLEKLSWAEGIGADLVVFPELAVCGYPPRDLLEHPAFVDRNLMSVERIAARTKKTGVVIGCLSRNISERGRGLFNSAGFLVAGKIKFVQHKTLLPSYDVFDETRHFEPATEHGVFEHCGVKIGLSLCEDIWSAHPFEGRRIYAIDPIEKLVAAGADCIINISASPFSLRKDELRESLICNAARKHARPIVYCNLIGGNDELVFDGGSLMVNEKGETVHEAQRFVEDNFVVDLRDLKKSDSLPPLADVEEVREALVLGLRDYMSKCRFSKAVLGISGGIDSAVVSAIAVEAAGPQNVKGFLLPSPYTSQQSTDAALALARNVGMATETIPIASILDAYRKELSLPIGKVSLVEENLQARIRGNIIMAESNKTGALVLSTGNKSELSVGYCTLYGDMAGGIAVISDVPKTMVYKLARLLNREREVIPTFILERPPSAELKPNQKDQDSLPPYEILDEILRYYVEEQMSIFEIAARGFDPSMVAEIAMRIDRNEYKRRQAPPGFKISWKAFGSGRRFPIAWKS